MQLPNEHESLTSLCMQGVSEAVFSCSQMAREVPVEEAPEWLLQACIMRKLYQHGHSVTVETSVARVMSAAKSEIGEKQRYHKGGRIDLVTWNQSNQPVALVEVKIGQTPNSINADVGRLATLIAAGGSIQQGLLIVYSSAKSEKRLVQRIESIAIRSGSKLVQSSEPAALRLARGFEVFWCVAAYEVKI